ncbi:MAG: hypothetical protein IPJ88_11365 [Myxococcales bacterium]|nr:MAG: hypothetical protein IPJ88_11365 [Myxococcales bacterium]
MNTKRQWRNYLLDSRFQFKHIGMVMAAVLVVAAVLGFFAYDYSQGQTEALTIQMAMHPDLNPQVASSLEQWAADQDRRVLFAILLGVFLLVVAMLATGLVVTHRLVGPAYKLTRLIREVELGNLNINVRFRKGDELQELGDAFAGLVASLRSRQADQRELVEKVLIEARVKGVSPDLVAALETWAEDLRRSVSQNAES